MLIFHKYSRKRDNEWRVLTWLVKSSSPKWVSEWITEKERTHTERYMEMMRVNEKLHTLCTWINVSVLRGDKQSHRIFSLVTNCVRKTTCVVEWATNLYSNCSSFFIVDFVIFAYCSSLLMHFLFRSSIIVHCEFLLFVYMQFI